MLHPSKFFKWCVIRTGIDVFEIFDETIKEELINIHPRNFIRSKVELPIYKVIVGYETAKGKYKESEKYMILNNCGEQENEDMFADMFIKDYESEYKESIKNIEVLSSVFIGDAVLQIG